MYDVPLQKIPKRVNPSNFCNSKLQMRNLPLVSQITQCGAIALMVGRMPRMLLRLEPTHRSSIATGERSDDRMSRRYFADAAHADDHAASAGKVGKVWATHLLANARRMCYLDENLGPGTPHEGAIIHKARCKLPTPTPCRVFHLVIDAVRRPRLCGEDPLGQSSERRRRLVRSPPGSFWHINLSLSTA